MQAQAWNFIKKETLAQVFSCEFCEISKYTFSYMTHPVAASSSQIRAFLICFMSPRIFTEPNGIQRRDICGNVFNLTGNFQQNNFWLFWFFFSQSLNRVIEVWIRYRNNEMILRSVIKLSKEGHQCLNPDVLFLTLRVYG